MWCWLLTAADVGLLRDGWRTEDLTRAGVFLVAPPDPAFLRAAASSFTAVVPQPLELPGLMVSSDNDPYCAPRVADQLATDWGVPRIGVGRLGHINSSSGIGRWDLGRALLNAFTAGLRIPSMESRRRV
jgi:predicted alpha/beta hydrolase family esterase